MMIRKLAAGAAALAVFAGPAYAQAPTTILNASYDIGRELFAAINEAFVAAHPGVTVEQSHAGSSTQARAVLEGLAADVVTFNQVIDIDTLVNGGAVSEDWQAEFPNNSSPFYSLPAFLVREGNPLGIDNWDDLVAEGVEVVFPNPKTSGNARYTYLAAYAFALEQFGGDVAETQDFVRQIFDHVPVFDTGGRAATTTFVERQIGDVLITFEAEVRNIVRQYGETQFDIVVPPVSLLAEFPVAVVDSVVDRRGSRDLATEYLQFLYTPQAQRIEAENGHRPVDSDVAAEFADAFPAVRLLRIEDVFGSWDQIQAEHFAGGGILDQLYGDR